MAGFDWMAPDASPAHAGIDPGRSCSRRGRDRFPRPRGDRPAKSLLSSPALGLPPPTRGSTQRCRTYDGHIDASPAHAGIDPGLIPGDRIIESFPRPRGDRPGSACALLTASQLPPPTRGSTVRQDWMQGRLVASPAHAGIDPLSTTRLWNISGFPRPRGDRPSGYYPTRVLEQLPPPTRGSTSFLALAARESSASPAHAGIDLGGYS